MESGKAIAAVVTIITLSIIVLNLDKFPAAINATGGQLVDFTKAANGR